MVLLLFSWVTTVLEFRNFIFSMYCVTHTTCYTSSLWLFYNTTTTPVFHRWRGGVGGRRRVNQPVWPRTTERPTTTSTYYIKPLLLTDHHTWMTDRRRAPRRASSWQESSPVCLLCPALVGGCWLVDSGCACCVVVESWRGGDAIMRKSHLGCLSYIFFFIKNQKWKWNNNFMIILLVPYKLFNADFIFRNRSWVVVFLLFSSSVNGVYIFSSASL